MPLYKADTPEELLDLLILDMASRIAEAKVGVREARNQEYTLRGRELAVLGLYFQFLKSIQIMPQDRAKAV